MGRNLFAPQGQPAPAAAANAQPRAGRNLFATPEPENYEARTAGMTREQLVDEYRKAKINSPYYNHLVAKIEAPQAGETPEQAALRSGGQQPTGAPSQLLSGLGGAADTMAFGFADEIGAGAAALGGGDYNQALEKQRRFRASLEEENPGSYLTGQIAGVVPQIVGTLGVSGPMTGLGRMAANTASGAAQGGAYGFGSGEGVEGRLGEAASGAAIGGALGFAPSVVEGAYKGGKAIIGGAVRNVQKVTNPKVAAEKELVRQMVKDWKAGAKEEGRALSRGKPAPPRRFLNEDDLNAAEGAGQRTMVSDIGGDATRLKLDAAANISDEASNDLRGAAAQRQSDSGARTTQVVNDTFGDTNPKAITDDLRKQAQVANKAAYDLADAHPNATHMWNPVLQRALSTPAGKKALKTAIQKSREKALNNSEEVIEPIFEEDANGLMQFSGRFRKPSGEAVEGIEGIGLNLRFWDRIKRSMQDDINELQRIGRNDDAADIIATKNEMVANLDQSVPDYKTARGTAQEFFGKNDALEAGADYFRNMGSFDIAEARDALQKMSVPERELFARGYAGQLVTRISQMGEAENVAKLFKSPQARMKMRDAMGDDVADQLEAYTHREVVQSYLGTLLGSNSLTAKRQIAAEGLRAAAGGAGGWWLGNGDPTSIGAGMLVGLASRGGYRFTQRKVIERYAREMAELATSDDPAVIARILTKVSQDPGYMKFSRAVADGMPGNAPEINIPGGGLPGGAERIDPRMPFAAGGRVAMSKAGLVSKAAEAAGKLLGFVDEGVPKVVSRAGRSTVKHPVRKAFPGIYKDPRALLDDVQIEPEHPALKQLFGVTRDDLYEISKRKGNVDDILKIKDKPARGSAATDNIKTPRNAQRLVDALEVARTNEDLWKGMHGWYTMDPAYQQLVRDYGPEEAERLFRRYNTLTGMASPGSEVMTELQRGTAANMMDNKGLWDEFMMFGGTSVKDRGHNFPREISGVDGHPYHSTSQAPAMDTFVRTGKVDMKSAKVPTYIGASTPPELGNFTDLPIADAHFTRAVGLPDTRTAEKVYDHSMTMGEYKSVAPWYRDEVASKAGLEGVPAQAIHWGLFGPQTGVTTPVGAPKLELLARGIMETARRLGISPEKARDLVLTGKAHAFRNGGFVSALGAAA